MEGIRNASAKVKTVKHLSKERNKITQKRRNKTNNTLVSLGLTSMPEWPTKQLCVT